MIIRRKTTHILNLLILFLALVGCKDDITPEISPTNQKKQEKKVEFIADVIRIKLKPNVEKKILKTRAGEEKTSIKDVEINDFLNEIGAESMERVFPHAGIYEERTIKEGLHLWYDVKFENKEADKEKRLQSVESKAMKLTNVDIVEKIINIQSPNNNFRTIDTKNIYQTRSAANEEYFNDPQLPLQWNYNNKGNFINSKAGADINLYKAWAIETGKPKVIVSIVDGGIDYKHEDLKGSICVNEKELKGYFGVDDDGNGFVDDVYGYNFVKYTGLVTAHPHGTHVAGTVAARNNNGVGVAGIAGGDGNIDSGVRLLSCQVFALQNNKTINGNIDAAIKYGADNGAVISQNSWGIELNESSVFHQSTKEAIDYFVKYAGCDNNGNQLPDSPMKGGILVFAAGNDGVMRTVFPAAYEKVIAVSAMGVDFVKTYYTNMGEWIDIMAPGGSFYNDRGSILSTLPNNQYGYEQGTSMACPHVSGVAALIVSKYGKQGFTAEELTKRLLTSLKAEDIYEYNKEYKGILGKGYIDAHKALSDDNKKKPNSPNINSSSFNSSVRLQWEAVYDEDDDTAFEYHFYYSPTPFSDNNKYKESKSFIVKSYYAKAGEKLSYTHTDLHSYTNIYYAVVATDRWGNSSEPYYFSETIKSNEAPKMSVIGEQKKIRVSGFEEKTVSILVKDTEKDKWTASIKNGKPGTKIELSGDTIKLYITSTAGVGNHHVTIVARDKQGAESEITIDYEVFINKSPKAINKDIPTQYIYLNDNEYVTDLSSLFSDEDKLAYEVKNFNTTKANFTIKEDKLHIVPKEKGIFTVEIVAKDTYGAKTNLAFPIHILDDKEISVYPIPTKDFINITLPKELSKADIEIYSTMGKKLISNKVVETRERVVKIDLSTLNKGSYILKVNNSNFAFEKAILKI